MWSMLRHGVNVHNGAGPAVLSVVAGASSAVVAARSKAATAASAIGGPSSSGRCMMKTSTLAFRSAALPFVVSSTGTTTDTSAAVDARDGRLATKMRHTGGRGPQRRMRSTTASSPECLYRVLGVSRSATKSQIKAAYMALAKKYHPDRAITDDEDKKKEAHDRFAGISAAFDTLGDTFSRQEYDMKTATIHFDPKTYRRGQKPWERQGRGEYREGAHHYYPKDEFAETRGNINNMKSAEDDNFRFMSNSTVVVLACLWMVGGALMHYWRFGAASEEVRAIVDERSRTAAGILDTAHLQARENGSSGQLDRLREAKLARDSRRKANAVGAAGGAPAPAPVVEV